MSDGDENTLVMQVDEELFGGMIDNIEAYTDRLGVVADPEQLSLLYTVYTHDEITRGKLKNKADCLTNEEFESRIKKLCHHNLIARVVGPDDTDAGTYYRITRLGKDIIEHVVSVSEGERKKISNGREQWLRLLQDIVLPFSLISLLTVAFAKLLSYLFKQ